MSRVSLASGVIASGAMAPKRVYNDDFDISSAEQAIKHQYDAHQKEWARTLINVVIRPQPFAEGAMRQGPFF